MREYVKVTINISEGQQEKIRDAMQSKKPVSIKLKHADLRGEHVIAITLQQAKKLATAWQNGKGATIKMSKTQLQYNSKIEGGFIGAILPALATAGKFLLSSILPSLATGALTGVGAAAGSIVDKISGSGGVLYWKKNGEGCKIIPTGQGFYLSPWQKASTVGNGLYLKTPNSGGYVGVGTGLLLGPNSPFQNIPILGMIL